jgi:hypothetical protein
MIHLSIHDLSGREIRVLVNEYRAAGSYQINFNTVNLASGIYVYTLRAGNFVESKKMIVLK